MDWLVDYETCKEVKEKSWQKPWQKGGSCQFSPTNLGTSQTCTGSAGRRPLWYPGNKRCQWHPSPRALPPLAFSLLKAATHVDFCFELGTLPPSLPGILCYLPESSPIPLPAKDKWVTYTIGWLTQRSVHMPFFPLPFLIKKARKNKYFVLASFAASGNSFYVWPMSYEGMRTGKLLGKLLCFLERGQTLLVPPHSTSVHLEHDHDIWAATAVSWPRSNSMRIKSKWWGWYRRMSLGPWLYGQVSKPMPDTAFSGLLLAGKMSSHI